MGEIESRIEELGLTLPPCPTPVAAYVPAVEIAGFVYASGQTPILDGKLMFKGKLGRDVSIEEGYEAARLAALRVISELKATVGDLDRVGRIVKVTGYVNSADNFGDQPKVVNGASELIRDIFGKKGEHARVAFGVAALPDDAAVEIDLIAYVKRQPGAA
jgi:enamine deaminase RidA (YjgF/YER057c/UK114 family)